MFLTTTVWDVDAHMLTITIIPCTLLFTTTHNRVDCSEFNQTTDQGARWVYRKKRSNDFWQKMHENIRGKNYS